VFSLFLFASPFGDPLLTVDFAMCLPMRQLARLSTESMGMGLKIARHPEFEFLNPNKVHNCVEALPRRPPSDGFIGVLCIQ
jgi:hypothetical protein